MAETALWLGTHDHVVWHMVGEIEPPAFVWTSIL